MLASQTTASATGAGWRTLDIPHRLALVIDRVRLIGGNDQVRDQDFAAAPETCDLSKTEIEANLGKASQILEEDGAPAVPPYSREARLQLAVALVTGLMPAVPLIHTTLRQQAFTNSEIADLWGDLVKGASEGFRGNAAPSPDMPDWGRKQLTENAN